MADNLSSETRSKIMSTIRGKNTKPEIKIRKIIWSRNKRYRIHDRTIFGTPDISNKKRRLAVFIDGCFWHGCSRCYKEPQTNTEFWRTKIKNNRERRKKVISKLKVEGWNIMEFWEHEINQDSKAIARKIVKML